MEGVGIELERVVQVRRIYRHILQITQQSINLHLEWWYYRLKLLQSRRSLEIEGFFGVVQSDLLTELVVVLARCSRNHHKQRPPALDQTAEVVPIAIRVLVKYRGF